MLDRGGIAGQDVVPVGMCEVCKWVAHDYDTHDFMCGRGGGGLIWFQPGVRHVGTVVIDHVLRIDEPDAFNTVHTIDVSDDVVINNLVIGHVRQHVPDDKKPVRIAKGATIRQLDVTYGMREDRIERKR